MIPLAQCQTTLPASRAAVFSYVTDMENYKDWFPGVVSIASANEQQPATVGKKYRELLVLAEGPVELAIEVVAVTPNALFATEGELPDILPRMQVTFTDAEDNGCTIDLRYDSREPNLAANPALLSMLREDLTERARAGLSKLARILG